METTLLEFIKIVKEKLSSIEMRIQHIEEILTSGQCETCVKEHDVIMDIMGVAEVSLRNDMSKLERKIFGEPEISAEESLYRF